MTTPRVTEIPPQLEAVEPDPFIDPRPVPHPPPVPDDRNARAPHAD
jgi:hypothetical protein